MKDLDGYITNILKARDSEEKCESFVNTFIRELESDGEKYSKKGYYMLKAIKENNLNDFLIAVCGWSSETLLKKAHLIPDDDNMFGDKVIDAKFVSIWDGGYEVMSNCKVDMRTHEVFDIEKIDMGNKVETLDSEHILIDDEYFDVFPKDQVDADEGEFITSFWYGESE